jgi:DNA invertase Pin-like site-specific DNA recombinase
VRDLYAQPSEEGLEQDFNSLHAQREPCEAYIKSQRHEGWVALPVTYDDRGYSGGTMERPALQQLLTSIQAGAVDVVVVYKVDRFTRSLSFAMSPCPGSDRRPAPPARIPRDRP